jgi:hypothetical protein
MKTKRQRRHSTRIRESYGEAISQKVAFDQDIHHIDHIHTNNNLENLVAIPKDLHSKYHSVFDLCRNKGFSIGQILRDLQTSSSTFKDLQLLYNEIKYIKNCQTNYENQKPTQPLQEHY